MTPETKYIRLKMQKCGNLILTQLEWHVAENTWNISLQVSQNMSLQYLDLHQRWNTSIFKLQS